MKIRSNLRTIIYLPALSLFFFSACSKKVDLNYPETQKEQFSKQPVDQQRAYVRQHLKKAMNELAPLFKDPLFIDYLRAEAAKQFDGDNNVLIKHIIENPEYAQRINVEKMQLILDAFKDIDGHNYYPQIYFPFFEEHRSKRKNNARGNVVGGTEMVLYDGDETVVSVPIYQYDDITDSLMETGSYANEEYAEENELLVVSLNESVEDDGRFIDIEEPGGTGGVNSTVNFWIKDLTIKDGKESWLGGKSEVHIKSNGTTWSHILNGNTSGPVVSIPNLRYAKQTDMRGHQIKKVRRGEIGYPIYNINYPMNKNWAVSNYYVDPIVYTYVIFEYDPIPAVQKTLASKIPSALNPENQQDAMNFRSFNTPYGGTPGNAYINYAIYGNVLGLPQNLKYLYYDGHVVSTEDIDFKTVKY